MLILAAASSEGFVSTDRAVEIIQKPKLGTKQFLEESRVRICDVIKAANIAKSRIKKSSGEKRVDKEKDKICESCTSGYRVIAETLFSFNGHGPSLTGFPTVHNKT